MKCTKIKARVEKWTSWAGTSLINRVDWCYIKTALQIFNNYHAGTSSGRIGHYKTLFWLRKYIFAKGCTHYIMYNTLRKQTSKINFSRPIRNPLYIIHLDVWSPVTISNSSGKHISLITAIFNLTQFLILSFLDQFMLQSVAKISMKYVVLYLLYFCSCCYWCW